MKSLKELEKRVKNIEDRNKRVELDKAWETSLERKVIVAALTYLVITVFLLMLRVENAFLTAVIPSIAFLLSTMTLSFFKELWLKNK